MIKFQESTAERKDVPQLAEDRTATASAASTKQRAKYEEEVGTQARPVVPQFINTTNHGLKVKMPDSVHIFLPGETIEFLPKELGEDGAYRELARRARRAEMKSKASMDWAKRNKGK